MISAALAAAAGAGLAQSTSGSDGAGSDIYFRQDWCPDDLETAQMEQQYALSRDGCCIVRATPRYATSNRDALAPWASKIVPSISRELCTGSPERWTDEDRARVDRLKRDRLAVEAKEWQDRADEDRRLMAERRAERKAMLEALVDQMADMTPDGVCASLGVLTRDGDGAVLAKARKLAATRGLRVDEALTKRERIKLGISECQLFASFGLPERANRSVGSWGVHVQYIYGRTYVYTKNGTVTSWQD